MENSKVLKAILFISGLLLTIIGGAILFMPVVFSARNGIELGDSISLLNDIRASGALMLAGGLLILSGAFISQLRFMATVVSILMFLSLGIGRIVSIVMDGMPAEGLVKATVVEMIIGFVGIFALLKYRKKG